MKQQLSAPFATVWQKFILPPLWIVGFGAGAVLTGTAPSESPANHYLFLSLWLVGSTFLVWLAVKLRKVTLEGRELVISNYFREVRVPLSEIAEVKQTMYSTPCRITVLLRNPTSLGMKASFIPKGSIQKLREHELTTQLRELVVEARALG